MTLNIHPIGEAAPHLKVLIYGDPGVGKTVFSGTAPNPLIVDVEHGTRSLLNHPELSHVRVLVIRTWAEMEELMNALEDGRITTETLVIDSVSELQRRVMDDQLQRKAQYGGEVFVPEGKDYQENTERMRRFAMVLRDLPINFILTSHAKEQESETGTTFLRPDLTPKFNATLMGQMDVVGYMRVIKTKKVDENDKEYIEEKRVLQVHPSDKVMAKTRIALPPALVNPTWSDLVKANEKGNN